MVMKKTGKKQRSEIETRNESHPRVSQAHHHHHNHHFSQYRDLQAVFLAGALLSFLYTAWPFHLKVGGL